MDTARGALEWSARYLDERLERGEPFFLLDVRHREEFETVAIEGRGALPGRNVPYFEMLEAAESDDLVEAVARYVDVSLGGELPRDTPVLAVWAKGGFTELLAVGPSPLLPCPRCSHVLRASASCRGAEPGPAACRF